MRDTTLTDTCCIHHQRPQALCAVRDALGQAYMSSLIWEYQFGDFFGGFGLHSRGDVGVGVERGGNVGVPEPLLNDFGVDAVEEGEGRPSVTEVM